MDEIKSHEQATESKSVEETSPGEALSTESTDQVSLEADHVTWLTIFAWVQLVVVLGGAFFSGDVFALPFRFGFAAWGILTAAFLLAVARIDANIDAIRRKICS